MTKLEHQVEELTKAFSDLINIERTKAKLDVFSIIKDGYDASLPPHEILKEVLNWVSSDIK